MKKYGNVKPQLIYYWLVMACGDLGLLIDGQKMLDWISVYRLKNTAKKLLT